MAHIRSSNKDDYSFVLNYVFSIVHPYDQFHAIANWSYRRVIWTSSFVCTATVVASCVFLGWNNVKAFAFPPQQRCNFFVSQPSWWLLYKCRRLLSVPCYRVHGFLVLRITHPSFWSTGLVLLPPAFGDHGILRFIRFAFLRRGA